MEALNWWPFWKGYLDIAGSCHVCIVDMAVSRVKAKLGREVATASEAEQGGGRFRDQNASVMLTT